MINLKKSQEREYLDSFRYFCKDFPNGEIVAGETPDFIVEKAGHRVGIEITRIFIHDGTKKTAQQAVEAARDRITARAKQHAGEMGGPPRAVTLFFNWTLQLRRKDEEAIARAVAKAVLEGLPEPNGSAELDCHSDSIQPSEVDLIIIHRVHPVEGFEWEWREASRTVADTIPLITEAIHRKGNSIHTCRSKCHECWLLVVGGEPLLRASGNIKPNAGSLNHTYVSPFVRTYFLDFGQGSVSRLNTISESS